MVFKFLSWSCQHLSLSYITKLPFILLFPSGIITLLENVELSSGISYDHKHSRKWFDDKRLGVHLNSVLAGSRVFSGFWFWPKPIKKSMAGTRTMFNNLLDNITNKQNKKIWNKDKKIWNKDKIIELVM